MDVGDAGRVLSKQGQGKAGGKCRNQRRVSAQRIRIVPEHADQFVVEHAAVFDGIDAGQQRTPHAFRALRVRADNNTVLMRLIANRPHLFHAHLRAAGLADFLCIGYAAGRGDFDGVDASLEILRDCGTRLFRGAAGQCDKRGAMAFGNRHQRSGCQDTRSEDLACINLIA